MKTRESDALYKVVEKKLISYMEEAQNLKLPTEAELAERFEVSRTTITKALETLERKGLIKKRRGHGNFILRSVLNEKMPLNSGADYAHLIEHAGLIPTLIREIQQYDYPSKHVREQLGMSLDEIALKLHYYFLADKKPAIHTVQHVPKKLLTNVPSDATAVGDEIDSWDFFSNYTEQIFSHVIFEFVPVQNPAIADYFGLKESTCLQMLRQRSYNIYDQVIAYSETHLHPDIMKLSLSAKV